MGVRRRRKPRAATYSACGDRRTLHAIGEINVTPLVDVVLVLLLVFMVTAP
jgi:biopolymer transport protein ExbD